MLKYNDYINEALKKVDPEIISAAKKGSNSKIEKLIKSGADINVKDVVGRTALMYATDGKFISVVDTLLNAGADVNITTNFGENVLTFARTTKILNKLLDAGADVNKQNSNGRTVLTTYLSGNKDLLKVILDRREELKVDFDIKDVNGDNFYDNIKLELNARFIPDSVKNEILKIKEFMDIHYPQYKKEWDFKETINKYNL